MSIKEIIVQKLSQNGYTNIISPDYYTYPFVIGEL